MNKKWERTLHGEVEEVGALLCLVTSLCLEREWKGRTRWRWGFEMKGEPLR